MAQRSTGNRASARAARAPQARPTGRSQRLLATMAFTIIGLSALAIIALLVLTAAGVPAKAFDSGVLLLVKVLPFPGLIIGLALVIALLVVGVVTRSRAARR